MPVIVGFSWDGLWHWVFSWFTTLAVRKNNRDIRCQTRLQPVEIPWGSNGSWSHVGSNRIESPRSVRNLEQPGGCRLCQIMFLCEGFEGFMIWWKKWLLNSLILLVSEDAFFTEGFEGNFVEGNGGVLGAAKGWARKGWIWQITLVI